MLLLGNVAAGVMGNDQKLVDKILEAGQVSGEKAWQLPMWDEYQSYLDSNFADIANIAPGRAAGTIEGDASYHASQKTIDGHTLT